MLSAVLATVAFADERPGTGTGRRGEVTIDRPTQVNRSTRLANAVTAGSTTLDVQAAGSFEPGELALLMVPQAATSLTTDSDTARLDDTVGTFTFVRVQRIDATRLELTSALERDWPAHAQLIFVPEFENLTVTSTGQLTALQWNGETGGVLVLLVRGRLSIDGTLHADGLGFRGAAPFLDGATLRGETGEGLVRGQWPGLGSAVAPLGGAPGSTRGASTGGGGGGNSTRGGNAPFSFNVDSGEGPGGIGGLRVEPTFGQRIIFGGGAGACRLNAEVCARGGSGGGAVVVIADSIEGSGRITAHGTTGADRTVPNRGMARGSAGAGGTLLVRANRVVRTAGILANGADGTAEPGCCNAGAAGGAGRVFVAAERVEGPVGALSGITGLISGQRRDGSPAMAEAGDVDVRTEPATGTTPANKLAFVVNCGAAPGWVPFAVLALLVRRRWSVRFASSVTGRG